MLRPNESICGFGAAGPSERLHLPRYASEPAPFLRVLRRVDWAGQRLQVRARHQVS